MSEWSDRQKKAYHRVLAGIRRHRFKVARFMTLTSNHGMKQSILDSFTLLRKRLYWVYPITFVAEGYYSYETACNIYGEDKLFEPWDFDYMKVCTSEGVTGVPSDEYSDGKVGVIHVIYFGIQIPQNWVSDQWYDITGTAYIVDMRMTYKRRDGNFNDLARYCIEQYTAGQDEFLSYYCSHGWIFKGAWRCYSELKERYTDHTRVIGDMYGNLVYFVNKQELIPAWYSCIDRGGLLPETEQNFIDAKDGFQEFLASVKSARKDFGFNW